MRKVQPFYLFLDFDGVLHGERVGEDTLFEHADRLGALLTPFPEVQVIVSSSWREVHDLVALRQRCGALLGPRLVDVTPIFLGGLFYIGLEDECRLWNNYGDGHLGAPLPGAFDVDTQYVRFAEIAMWLAVVASDEVFTPQLVAGSALARHDWVALDDIDEAFPRRCTQLLHVAGGAGLKQAHLMELEARLIEHRHVPL